MLQRREAVADDIGSSNTDITSCVSQTTLSPTENEEEIDDQIRNIDSHEIQCEKEYEVDLRVDTPTLFFPEKIRDGTTQLDTESTLVQDPVVNQGLGDKHSEFEMKREMSDTSQCVISTIDHRHTGKGKSKHTGKGKGKHVDVVETHQPSETASTMLAIESGDADENMNIVRTEAEAWRLIHSRYAQNTTEMISGLLSHDHADKYNQLSDESKEQKHTDNQRNELQPILGRMSHEVS